VIGLQGFPRERTWLLPALHAVQHEKRWISPEDLTAVSEHLRVPLSEVYGVATHYPEFRLGQPGRRVARVCVGVSCRILGSLELLAALERRLGVTAPGTSADGAWTLEPFDCAFNCSMAPVAEVDGRHLGRLGPDDADRVLGAPAPPARTPEAAEADRAAPAVIAVPTPMPSPLPEGDAGPGLGQAADPVRWFAASQRLARALSSPGELRLAVGVGSCGLSVGAAVTLAALAAEVGRRGIRARVVAAGCPGLCWAAPTVTVLRPEGAVETAARVGPGEVGALLDAVAAGRRVQPADVTAYLAGQRRVLTDRCGLTDPGDMADAIHRGSYATFAAALASGDPVAVIEAVKSAKLQGRGGAYFPAAVKWEGARRAAGEPKYLIVNGEEGEPGIFKDRHLLEGDPHRLLEGALLAAYAAGASRIYLYIHGEAELAARRMERALDAARRWGLVSQHVLGSDFSVEVEIRRGAGGFVLGEETALMESLEGRRAMPRAKPPFPVEAGLWGRPTVINNVETLFAVPLIVARGAAWWTGLGGGHGMKCFGLSGHLRRPGFVELPLGATLRDLLEGLGGGPAVGHTLQAVLVGGPSGSLVPPRLLDEPLVPGGTVNPGTGGVTALDDRASLRDVVRTLLDFNTRESCGKCTPCREGTARLRDLLDGRSNGGPSSAGRAVTELADVVRLASLCGLGQAAPLSILSGFREFPSAFIDLSLKG
jgi:NADH:ubiquinone oxidoreductase subunit F (NADH-binding)/NADH:ubiquinone oxidoreductase subunit E